MPNFKPRDKSPSLLKRGDDGRILDRSDAKKTTEELMRKLLTEERIHDKEQSFHAARTGKRDIVVMMGVYVRNSVNGKIVIGDNEGTGFERFSDRDMFKYRTFDMLTVEFPARNLPGGREFIGKGLMTGFNRICQMLMKMGMIR